MSKRSDEMTDYTIENNPMGYEDELKILVKMSLPAMFSMFIQSMYNIVDSYFVAQLGEKALRAITLSYPIQLMLIAFCVGTGVGVNSYMSRKLGAKQREEAGNAALHGYIIMTITRFVFILFRFFFMNSFYEIFTDDPEVISMGRDYLGVVTLYGIFLFQQVISEKIIQATGEMRIPMISHLISAVINIFLDPVLIHGYFFFPEMGVKGAAVATVFSQFVGFMFVVPYTIKHREEIGISIRGFRPKWSLIKDIYIVGIPSILMNSIAAILTMALNRIIINLSEVGVTVFGIYTKLQSFVFMPIFGMGQGFMPLTGYNYGAKNKDRIKNFYKYAIIIGLGISIIGVLIFQFLPSQLLSIFGNDPQIIELGVPALRIISTSFVFAGISIVNATYFQGIGIGSYSLIISAMRQLVILLPLAKIFSKYGLVYVWLAFPISEFIALLLSHYYYKKVEKNLIENL